jgi:Uncharacterized protein conserved in bacteria (DUF2169)
MFVRNRSGLPAVLARGYLTDDLAVAAVSIETVYRVGRCGLEPVEAPVERLPQDPPDEVLRRPMWSGASVSVAGTVHGPGRAPHVRSVVLSVASAVQRLAVFGARRWRKALSGAPAPSEPEPLEDLPLAWEHAFGGSFDQPPGLDLATGLPSPGGRVAFPLNPGGTGFYADVKAAIDGALPRVELADQLIQQWTDRPEPGGFAPCPELAGLRISHRVSADLAGSRDLARPGATGQQALFDLMMSTIHHAPPRLIFSALAVGAPIALEGVGAGPLRFAVPPPPGRVTLRKGRTDEPARGRVRSLHIDADRCLVRIVHGHMFQYPPDNAPSWIKVERAS